MAWPTSRYQTAVNGGAWGYDKMNGVQDWLLRPAGIREDDINPALGLGAAFVQSTSFNTTSAAYISALPAVEQELSHSGSGLLWVYSTVFDQASAGIGGAGIFVDDQLATELPTKLFGGFQTQLYLGGDGLGSYGAPFVMPVDGLPSPFTVEMRFKRISGTAPAQFVQPRLWTWITAF